MEKMISKATREWASCIYKKIESKLEKEVGRLGDKIPYIAENGVYKEDWGERDIAWWTNGFWGGIMWQMYHASGKEIFRMTAERLEASLDRSMEEYEGLYHDVGFMWMHTAVANYRLTGNQKSYIRGQHAANLLAGRFNVLGNFIRAWNDDKVGWVIVDCLMNLSLLYWASEETKDPRFRAIAERHADTALEKVLRADGSSNHIVVLDPLTGNVNEILGGQGYGLGSSWSRGQSWAVYGMAISYAHTKEEKYLDAAKRAAHYFIANVAMTDYLPLCDFRAPEEPLVYDSTAGACAACGMLEIAKYVPEFEKRLYVEGAVRILKAMEASFCNWNEEEDGILGMGKPAYHQAEKEQIPIIYGDYFFIEGILRLLDMDFFIW